MLRCPKCDKTFDENKIFGTCPYCGNERGLKYFSLPTEGKVKNNRVKIVLGVLIVIAIIFISIGSCNQPLNLKNIASHYFENVDGVTYHGDRNSVVVVVTYIDNRTETRLKGMLRELGFSSAVIQRMYATRSLDGTLREESKKANVTWTYHPDGGLRIVFEAER